MEVSAPDQKDPADLLPGWTSGSSFLCSPDAAAAASFRSSCVEVLGEAPGCRGDRRRLLVSCEEDCDDVS